MFGVFLKYFVLFINCVLNEDDWNDLMNKLVD